MKTTNPALQEVTFSDGVKPLLTGERLRIFRTLLAIAGTQARAIGLSIKSARIYQSDDPEEHDKELVLEVVVNASAAQALAYWEAAGTAVDTWKDSLSARERSILIGESSLRVVWEDGRSVQPA